AVTCDMILRSVLLPAPFRPMIPKTSPSLTSKLTSSRAQNRSPRRSAWRSWLIGRSGSGFPRNLAHQRERACPSIPPPITPRRYSLLRCSTKISVGTRQTLYRVHEDSLDVCEEHQPEREQHEHAHEARDELLRVHGPHSEEAESEALHDGREWIELRQPTV